LKVTPASEPDPNRHALLIGCKTYPGRRTGNRSYDLEGPRNDIPLLRKLLIEQYRFPPGNVVVLNEEGDRDHKPTRRNIVREFKALPGAVGEGEGHRVFISYSGHGSQQPDQNGDETDGLDEILLPEDTGIAADENALVPNAIIDDELGVWLKDITDRKARVTIVIDACSSGTAIKGEKSRIVPMEDLGIGPAAVQAAQEKAAKTFGGSRGPGDEKARESWADAAPEGQASQERLAAIYAALPGEPEPERSLPPFNEPDYNKGPRLVYGQLTFALNRALLTANSPMTCNELAGRVSDQYRSWWGCRTPVPFAEGGDRGKAFLGDEAPKRSPYRLDKDDRGLKVDAGRLHSISDGTIFAVLPPPGLGSDRTPLGYVQIPDGGNELLESRVTPVSFDGHPAVKPELLPQGGECKIVLRAFPASRLRVAVESDLPDGQTDASVTREIARLREVLKGLQDGKKVPIELVDEDPRTTTGNRSEWLLRVGPSSTSLVPTRSLTSKAEAQLQTFRFNNIPRDDRATRWLDLIFTYIGRAQSLLRVVQPLALEPDNQLRVEMRLYPPVKAEAPTIKTLDINDKVHLYNGDRIGFRFKNQGRDSVDVNILFVRNSYGITSVFPPPDTEFDNRLQPNLKPNDELENPIKMYNNRPSTNENVPSVTRGFDQIIVLAVRAQAGNPVNFGRLGQVGLDSQGFQLMLSEEGEIPRAVDLGRAAETPLGKLLNRVAIGGKRGDFEPVSIGNVTARLIGVEFSTDPRPVQP
jgi:hypothetical protein